MQKTFEASASSSANSSETYSWTVTQPSSDLSASLIIFCLVLIKKIPLLGSSFAFGMSPLSKAYKAAPLVLVTLRLKLNCGSFPIFFNEVEGLKL